MRTLMELEDRTGIVVQQASYQSPHLHRTHQSPHFCLFLKWTLMDLGSQAEIGVQQASDQSPHFCLPQNRNHQSRHGIAPRLCSLKRIRRTSTIIISLHIPNTTQRRERQAQGRAEGREDDGRKFFLSFFEFWVLSLFH